ncbi:TetR/AcrR family transcriptional regulator [Cryptosporangium phraense]|uniref:TetR/AcrR family transcriptional regulator n=1 Tax=Cryptosporangium phraense TaxID=2593070 RepID=A0A545ANE7_9ACTN|nr:TetR family transcriptional regulator [Cryptosporangium phraense]TQS42265.1 TetR/AcrR family transcriptional regulator [Cryptosporangium phraense]
MSRRSYVERVRAGMRDAVFDAVEQLIRDRGWQQTRMADVADAAGISRQTVYQLFGSREELAQQYVLWEADRFLGTVSDAVAAHADDPYQAIEAALDAFLTGAADNPMVKAILGGDDLLPLVTTQSWPVIEVARERLVAVIGVYWPQLEAGDVRLFAETVVRLAISHVTVAGGDALGDITRVLRPFITEVFHRASVHTFGDGGAARG